MPGGGVKAEGLGDGGVSMRSAIDSLRSAAYPDGGCWEK